MLFLWVVFLEELLVRRFGDELGLLATGAWEPTWLLALTGGGLAVALFTRGPADTTLHQASSRRCVVSLTAVATLWLAVSLAATPSLVHIAEQDFHSKIDYFRDVSAWLEKVKLAVDQVAAGP